MELKPNPELEVDGEKRGKVIEMCSETISGVKRLKQCIIEAERMIEGVWKRDCV